MDTEQIGVWQRIDNFVFMLERTTSPAPFDIRNRFSLLVQDQPSGSRKAECENIAEAIVVALNSSRDREVKHG